MNCEGYAVGTYAGKKEIAEAGRVKGKVAVKGKVGESGLNFIDNTAITHTSLRDFTYAGDQLWKSTLIH